MSKKIYIGLYAGSLVFAVLLVIAAMAWQMIWSSGNSGVNSSVGIFPASLGIGLTVFLLVHIVLYFVILAKMWGAIQDGQTEITVGKAIGFLFIPIFSIYWVFRAWGSYPTEYNKYVDRYALAVPKLSSSVFVAFPLLMVSSVLYLPILALPFVFMAVISKACDAVNNLN